MPAQRLPNRFDPLHDHVTVVSVPAVEQAAFAERLAAVLADNHPAVDLTACAIVRRVDVIAVAERMATARAKDRAAAVENADARLRAALGRLDRARARCDTLTAEITRLNEDAAQCAAVAARSDELYAMVASATAESAARRRDLDAAQQRLNHVIAQREASRSAVAGAERELSTLAFAGPAELDLRRDLETASQAARDAFAACEAATRRLEDLRSQQREVDDARAALETERRAVEWVAALPSDATARTEAALVAIETRLADAPPDPRARALADKITTVATRLAAIRAGAAPPPSPDELAAAEMAVVAAGGVESVTLDEWAEVEAAHEAVLHAADRTGRGFGRAAARRELAAATQAERSLLEQYGFDSYLQFKLSGGRRVVEESSRRQTDEDHATARQELADLRERVADHEAVVALEAEHGRLVADAAKLLGRDPGDRVVALLEVLRQVPKAEINELVAALQTVGVETNTTNAVTAARVWVRDARAAATVVARCADEEAQLDARDAELTSATERAESDLEAAVQVLESARVGPTVIEAELATRARDGSSTQDRVAEAHRLQEQIDSVLAALDDAEREARAEFEAAASASSVADRAWDRAAEALGAAGRRAQELATSLPPELRPTLGPRPLDGLSGLADALRAHALRCEHDFADASAAHADATSDVECARTDLTASQKLRDGGPSPVDFADALLESISAHPNRTIILEGVCDGASSDARDALVAAAADVSGTQRVVVVTDDVDVLGWAIALPPAVGSIAPATALTAAAPVSVLPDSPRPTDCTLPVTTATRGCSPG